MKTEIKERWIQLLESGEYNMGRDNLYQIGNDSYCPLGVLVEVALDEGVEIEIGRDERGQAVIDGTPHYLGPTLMEWSGISSEQAYEIARYNDSRSLKKAINYIKEEL